MRKHGCDKALSLFDTFDGIALIAPASSASATQPTRPQRPSLHPQSLGPSGACLVFQHHPQVSLASSLLTAGKLPLNPRQLINRRCPLAGCQRTPAKGRSIVGQELPQECPERKQGRCGRGSRRGCNFPTLRRKLLLAKHLPTDLSSGTTQFPQRRGAPF